MTMLKLARRRLYNRILAITPDMIITVAVGVALYVATALCILMMLTSCNSIKTTVPPQQQMQVPVDEAAQPLTDLRMTLNLAYANWLKLPANATVLGENIKLAQMQAVAVRKSVDTILSTAAAGADSLRIVVDERNKFKAKSEELQTRWDESLLAGRARFWIVVLLGVGTLGLLLYVGGPFVALLPVVGGMLAKLVELLSTALTGGLMIAFNLIEDFAVRIEKYVKSKLKAKADTHA